MSGSAAWRARGGAGFLVTGSWIAPALGHVFMHVEATTHGVEMPPVKRPPAGPSEEPPLLELHGSRLGT